jgi:hypothetical protein
MIVEVQHFETVSIFYEHLCFTKVVEFQWKDN